MLGETTRDPEAPGRAPEESTRDPEVTVEIPSEEVTKAVEQTIKKYQKVARIPGFRAGKVPTSIIKNRFMDDVRSEVADELIPKAFRAEVQKGGLLPVSQPRVTDLQFKEGEPLKFKAVFEVLPGALELLAP